MSLTLIYDIKYIITGFLVIRIDLVFFINNAIKYAKTRDNQGHPVVREAIQVMPMNFNVL